MEDDFTEANMEQLADIFEALDPSDFAHAVCRDRPYDGQPHTSTGARGKTQVRDVSFRDLRDAFILGCYQAAGLHENDWPNSLYKLPWEHMDPLAVCNNMLCEIERRMGIYPNVSLEAASVVKKALGL